MKNTSTLFRIQTVSNIFIIIITILFFSCSNKEIESPFANTLSLSPNNTLNLWLSSYIKTDKNFSLENFNFSYEDTVDFIEGSVFGTFDKEFNQVYLPFLIYNNNKQKYIDIDSYRWILDEDNEIIFSPDQEINLVDLQKKTVTRIGFNGPSEWAEDAFWENDSIVVFLENNYDNIPLIVKLNINNGIIKTYKYKFVVASEVYYTEKRISENINRI